MGLGHSRSRGGPLSKLGLIIPNCSEGAFILRYWHPICVKMRGMLVRLGARSMILLGRFAVNRSGPAGR